MNYYTQGDPTRADKIRAAFEKLGYKNGCNYTFASRDCIYFTISKDNDLYALGINFIELFRNNSDYQELELPVEPKFKVGDTIKWINHDYDAQTITDIRDGSYITVDKYGVRCALKFVNQDEWELAPKPHYDISNFKPFDKVLVRDTNEDVWRTSIFSHQVKGRYSCYPFWCVGNSYSQCIPYNDDTEHLLGTTDMCPEEYINW